MIKMMRTKMVVKIILSMTFEIHNNPHFNYHDIDENDDDIDQGIYRCHLCRYRSVDGEVDKSTKMTAFSEKCYNYDDLYVDDCEYVDGVKDGENKLDFNENDDVGGDR